MPCISAQMVIIADAEEHLQHVIAIKNKTVYLELLIALNTEPQALTVVRQPQVVEIPLCTIHLEKGQGENVALKQVAGISSFSTRQPDHGLVGRVA